MYLRQLDLHGFKSFATRTVVTFSEGVTAVVGPNGCGKSNIVDAVRWVIGEQRARILRSQKMENVIFNGTSKRRPLGMAEVLLTIENTRGVLPTEYTEVTIGRRLYRSGESEYLLNGVQCRLKDITDLFMDTGMGAGAYSVIELKMIEEILSDNAQDRRRLFEEAAGVTKYKRRRDQTIRKLGGTQADLTRLRDLIEELQKRVRSLKRQAKAAARYKEYEGRLRTLELILAQYEYDRLTAQQQQLQAERQALRDQVEAHTAQQAQAEARLEALRTDHIAQEQTLTAHQMALSEHMERLRALEAEVRLEQERLEAARRDQARTHQEQTDAGARRTTLVDALGRLQDALADAEPALEQAQAALEAARAERDRTQGVAEAHRQALQSLRHQEHRAGDACADRRRDLDRNLSRLDLLEQDQARVAAHRASLTPVADDLAQRMQAATEALQAAYEALEDARANQAAAAAAQQAGRAALEAAHEARHQAERRRDAAAAEAHLLDGLLTSYEDFSEAIQHLAEVPAWTDRPVQTVADVVACDDADRLALDAALGDYAAAIVVQTAAEAAAARASLQDHQKGRATFVILDWLPTVAPPAAPRPGATPLADRVRVSTPAYAPLAALLLHGCYLVPSLDGLRQAPLPGVDRWFTPAGEWLDGRGLVHAGSPQQGPSAAGGRLGLHEKREAAHDTLAALEASLEALVRTAADAQRDLAAVPYEAAQQALRAAEHALTEAEKEHDRVRYEAETLKRRRSELAARAEDLAGSLEAGQAALHTLETATDAAEAALEQLREQRAAAEEAFQHAEADSRAALTRYNEANLAAVQNRNRRDNLQRDLEQTRHRLHELDAQSQARATLLDTLAARIDATRALQADLAGEVETAGAERVTLEADVEAARAVLMETKAAISDVEAALREVRRHRENDLREESQRAVRLAEVGTRAEDLLKNIEEDYSRSLVDAPVEVPLDFEVEPAREEVRQLRQRIRSMGPVNALALESYEEESERLTFLSEQLQDLEQAESTLLETIDEINTTASARFNETFAQIQDNFTRLFRELFGEEATATLVLDEDGDPLESPIEIMAKPRGKRPSVLNQLSGGEKTLTATALLFAIYLVKPSPFCILDEVDAPLDDANIGRFMQLIRTFSESTQFILVTHNKRTMEAADCMYGVTMQEQGVSKLVGVKFDEAVEMAEV